MKRTILLLCVLLSTYSLHAQRELTVENLIQENAVFAGEGNDACVTITTPENMLPTFTENNRRKEPTKVDSLNGNINHHLVFDASPGRESRKLTINVRGYNPKILNFFLHPKEQRNYYVFDHDTIILSCHNQFVREGLNLFMSGIYEDARSKYLASLDCSSVPEDNDISDKIVEIDSILTWRNAADDYFDNFDFENAIEEYQKIFSKNPEDKYVARKIQDSKINIRQECSILFTTAESYYNEKHYEDALPIYQKVVEQSCYNSAQALQKIQSIVGRKELPHALSYEIASNTPIGLSTGNYKKKVSGYFSLRFNTLLFETLRSNNKDDAKPELNLSFGWTIKTVDPVWIFFGPGYSGVGEYLYDEDDVNKEGDSKLKIHSAISPELGLFGKIRINDKIGVVLRYTFQYRFALKKDTEDYIGKTRHVFGVGFCF